MPETETNAHTHTDSKAHNDWIWMYICMYRVVYAMHMMFQQPARRIDLSWQHSYVHDDFSFRSRYWSLTNRFQICRAVDLDGCGSGCGCDAVCMSCVSCPSVYNRLCWRRLRAHVCQYVRVVSRTSSRYEHVGTTTSMAYPRNIIHTGQRDVTAPRAWRTHAASVVYDSRRCRIVISSAACASDAQALAVALVLNLPVYSMHYMHLWCKNKRSIFILQGKDYFFQQSRYARENEETSSNSCIQNDDRLYVLGTFTIAHASR